MPCVWCALYLSTKRSATPSVHTKSGHVTESLPAQIPISLIQVPYILLPGQVSQQPDLSVCRRHWHLRAIDQSHAGIHFQKPIIGPSMCDQIEHKKTSDFWHIFNNWSWCLKMFRFILAAISLISKKAFSYELSLSEWFFNFFSGQLEETTWL